MTGHRSHRVDSERLGCQMSLLPTDLNSDTSGSASESTPHGTDQEDRQKRPRWRYAICCRAPFIVCRDKKKPSGNRREKPSSSPPSCQAQANQITHHTVTWCHPTLRSFQHLLQQQQHKKGRPAKKET